MFESLESLWNSIEEGWEADRLEFITPDGKSFRGKEFRLVGNGVGHSHVEVILCVDPDDDADETDVSK